VFILGDSPVMAFYKKKAFPSPVRFPLGRLSPSLVRLSGMFLAIDPLQGPVQRISSYSFQTVLWAVDRIPPHLTPETSSLLFLLFYSFTGSK